VSEGPGRSSEGGITIRPGEKRQVPECPEASGLLAGPFAAINHGSRTAGRAANRTQVSGGFAFAKWPITPTGESPTSSGAGGPLLERVQTKLVGRSIRPSRKDQTMRRSRSGFPDRRRLRDGSNPGVAD